MLRTSLRKYGVEAITRGECKAVSDGDEVETFIKSLEKAARLAALPEQIRRWEAEVHA
ncbi:hypothetical protein [Agrobacterium sp. NPDC089420]|uniref:hypothetical protein n=1 Tax=Agrobacterium sp. NPDC089420 TaxID=3363918 RepID=UPI00384E08D8